MSFERDYNLILKYMEEGMEQAKYAHPQRPQEPQGHQQYSKTFNGGAEDNWDTELEFDDIKPKMEGGNNDFDDRFDDNFDNHSDDLFVPKIVQAKYDIELNNLQNKSSSKSSKTTSTKSSSKTSKPATKTTSKPRQTKKRTKKMKRIYFEEDVDNGVADSANSKYDAFDNRFIMRGGRPAEKIIESLKEQ